MVTAVVGVSSPVSGGGVLSSVGSVRFLRMVSNGGWVRAVVVSCPVWSSGVM